MPPTLATLNPAPLHHQLGLAVLLACGKPSQNIAYMQSLGHVADIVRVWGWAWVMLQRGLVCIIKTSFQKASQPMKHCFLEGIGGIQARLIFAHFGAKRCRTSRRCGALALQNAANTANCAERWCSVRFAFARARDPSHKTLLFTVFCCICVSGLACELFFLRCCFCGLWRARARARPHVGLLGWGPARAQKAGMPGIIWGWGGQHA